MIVRQRRGWGPADYALLFVMLAVAVWLNRQPLLDMFAIGLRDEEQSHIFLAPIVALWLLWLRRSRLRFIPVQPSFIGLAVAAGGWLLSWWGFESGTQIAWHAGAIVCLVGVLLSFTGLAPLQRLAPVFVVLLFMLPIPGAIRHQIAHPLQSLATGVTHSMLELFGVSTVRSGNILIINGEQVAVGEACNGMRMVFALGLVVYAFAFGTALKPLSRAVLLIMSPLVAILCNVIRLVPTSLIFGYGDIQLAERFHDLLGWVMLPVALVMLAGVLRTIKWLEFPITPYRLVGQ